MDLHDVSVVVFIKYLERLSHTLQKLEQCVLGEQAQDVLLKTGLRVDMFPFGVQVLIGADFALRAIEPLLSKQQVEDMPINTLEQLRMRVQNRIEILSSVSRQDVNSLQDFIMTNKAGHAVFEANGLVFMTQYAIPNFFFHLSMAHAILRREGYLVGKGDFDGIHQYPNGFSFFEE